MVIRPTDRVATVIARDEALIDVFVALSPAFERLRNPTMRRVMARLVTIEQAARMAGVDVAELVARLNRALRGGGEGEGGGGRGGASVGRVGAGAAGGAGARDPDASHVATEGFGAAGNRVPPPALRALPPDRIIDVDVRDDLRQGREPFRRIMAARREVPDGGVLRVRAIFEPVPLYAVMARQGLAHWTERLGEEDWRVWFYAVDPGRGGGGEGGGAGAEARQSVAGAGGGAGTGGTAAVAADRSGARGAAPAGGGAGGCAGGGDAVVVLDVRGLEPPEPMMRTLEAIERLAPGETLVQLNVRVPQFLLPLLEERGCTYEIREQEGGPVRVFIRRRPEE